MSTYRIINKDYPQIDALAKVTGQQQYISDLRLPGMLWGQVVRSPYPHGKIKKINISKAMQIPGIRAIITAADTPQIPCGPFLPDWEILAKEKVTFIGQEVAAVAAIHLDAAIEAARLVELEVQELPAVYDPEVAMGSNAPLIREGVSRNIASTFHVEQGDVPTAFKESDYIREETFYSSSAFHAYLEPNGSIANYDPISDCFTLWLATQVPYKAWLMYSKALGIQPEKLHIIQVPMGGAFGGKFESNLHLVAACLSKKAKQPVRLVNLMADEFVTAPLRVPLKISLKVGIKKDGTLMAKEATIIAENGGRTHYGPAVLATACYRVDNLYRIFNTRADGYLVYTNNAPKGAMRGFGNAEILFAFETILDMLAEDAGIDPGDLRLKNTFKSGETTVHGWVIGSCGLNSCIQIAQEVSSWNVKRKSFSEKNGRSRGIGLACCNHVSGYRPILKEFDGSAAIVRIGPDGSIIVFTGEVDMGQGYKTVVAQIVAEELGVPLDFVQVAPVDSQISILGIGSLASRGTVMGGNAVKKAATAMRQTILSAAGSFLGRDKNNLQFSQGKLFDSETGEVLGVFREIVSRIILGQAGQPLIGVGYYRPDTVLPDPKTQYGNPSPAYSFGAHVAEVEVDLETGQVEVISYTAVNDVGRVINPLLAKGQLEGAILQGIGWTLSEKLILHHGQILNRNLRDYKIPTFADLPHMETLFVEEEDPNGPYGAKSLGEPAFNPVAAAICNAIYNAVGIRITQLPVTSEYLIKAMRTEIGTDPLDKI
jgi:CO/xanthine dehydrogenase Mo-binding subunit